MTYNSKTAKKCTFVKMGKKKGIQKKVGSKSMTPTQRQRALTRWNSGW
jgi:hypothetical protein|tara:strand:- start:163 stop:306 length:144 start_codon:yes stop_codon:yes gene_type:complete